MLLQLPLREDLHLAPCCSWYPCLTELRVLSAIQQMHESHLSNVIATFSMQVITDKHINTCCCCCCSSFCFFSSIPSLPYHRFISNPYLPRPCQTGGDLNTRLTPCNYKGLGTNNGWRAAGSVGAVTCCGQTSALSPSACCACSSVFGRAFNIGNLEVRSSVPKLNY